MKRLILFCSIILALLLQSPDVFSSQNIGILPFKDKTDYDGSWDIEKGIAISFGKLLSENPFYVIVPVDSLWEQLKPQMEKKPRGGLFGFLFGGKKESAKERLAKLVELGRKAGADILITGEINKFSLSRFQAGLPMLGGYESYGSTVELEARLLRVIDGKELGLIEGKGDITDRDLGITLFGKLTEKASQFYGLDEIPFGSEEFSGTVLGKTLAEALTQLKGKVEQVVVPPPIPKISEPAILMVDGDMVYINLGIEDGVEIGDKLNVYTEGEELKDPVTGVVLGRAEKKVGTIQILALRAAHLSKAKIVEGEGQIKAKDLVRVE